MYLTQRQNNIRLEKRETESADFYFFLHFVFVPSIHLLLCSVIFNNKENENIASIIHEAKKFNSLAILNFHANMTDETNFVEIENTFVSSHENLGKFTFDDEL